MTQTINREQVKAGLDAGALILIDALPESYYAQQHLPGALNLVADDVDTQAPRLLPDKNAALVTYCSNPACANSGQVATKLEKLGYTNVRKYADGIQDWTGAVLVVCSVIGTSVAFPEDLVEHVVASRRVATMIFVP